MKVLWFTNIPMPDVNAHFGNTALGSGGWMGGLVDRLKQRPELHMGVVTACSHYPESELRLNGVNYYIIKQRQPRLGRSVFPADNNPIYLEKCLEIIKSYKPDIIHIHGTERFYGALISRQLTKVQMPVRLSLTGIFQSKSLIPF